MKIHNRLTPIEGPIKRPEEQSEWQPIKFFRRMNPAYTENSQPRVPTRVCQGRVVTTDLPTLGTNPNSKHHGSATKEAKDIGDLRSPRWTVSGDRADGLRGSGGWSARQGRTV
jgi:hypothetical protein